MFLYLTDKRYFADVIAGQDVKNFISNNIYRIKIGKKGTSPNP
jgi:hypothetical protein